MRSTLARAFTVEEVPTAGTTAVGNISIVLAGVAVAALFTAVQTYLQQQHVTTIQEVYGWILGQLTLASWTDVRTVAPYAAISWGVP